MPAAAAPAGGGGGMSHVTRESDSGESRTSSTDPSGRGSRCCRPPSRVRRLRQQRRMSSPSCCVDLPVPTSVRLIMDEVSNDDERGERIRSRRRRKRWKRSSDIANENAAEQPLNPSPPISSSVTTMTTGLNLSESVKLHPRNLWPRSLAPLAALSFLLLLCAGWLPAAAGLRCYVCGGHSGKICLPILDQEGDLNGNKADEDDGGFFMFGSRNSPYVRRPTPPPDERANRQWEECNDLINHKGCMKQVVNNVVKLRACWMQGTNKCLSAGNTTYCNCPTDLCNGAESATVPGRGRRRLPRLVAALCVTLLLFLRSHFWTDVT